MPIGRQGRRGRRPLHHRLGRHFLRAGIGWGGSCFPKDGVSAEAARFELGLPLPAAQRGDRGERAPEAARGGQTREAPGEARRQDGRAARARFKPNTDDLREAPSLLLASRLLAEGADVRAWDPVADAIRLLQGVTFCDSVLEAVSGRDAAVIVTEWDELRELATDEVRQAMRRPLILDGRNSLEPEEARARRLHLRRHRPRRVAPGRASETEEPEPKPRPSGSDHPGGRQGRASRRGRGRTTEGTRRARGPAAGRLPGRAAREPPA